MINETVPVYLMGKYGAFTAMSAQIGYFIVFGFGFGLPASDYNPELQSEPENLLAKQADIDDQFWRVMYLFPVLVNTFMITCFTLLIQEDSIMFNLSQGNDAQALNLIKKVYHASENFDNILSTLKIQVQSKQQSSNQPAE